MKPTLKTIALAMCLITVPALTAAAQGVRFSDEPSSSENSVPSGKATVGDRLARDLASSNATTRERALAETAFHAHFGQRNVDLTPTLPALIKVYKSDPDEQRRIMAVSILDAIGDQDAMHALYFYAKQERSQRVQMVTLAALQKHLDASAFKGDKEMGAIATELLEWRAELREESPRLAAKN